ncbi:MAG TPA: hypothetical protein VK171_01505 [Fimbriimonas sp.]|nr:hypothetical protein [Fimbriimonas sp.]
MTEIDMLNYPSGCRVIAVLGTVTSGGIFTMKVKGSNTSSSYGAGTIGDLNGASVAVTDWSNKLAILEVSKPVEGCRYLQFDYQRTIANVVIQAIIIEQIADKVPITESTSDSSTVIAASPEKSTT